MIMMRTRQQKLSIGSQFHSGLQAHQASVEYGAAKAGADPNHKLP